MISTTTLRQLEQDVRSLIARITPTHPIERDGGWSPSEDNAPVGDSTLVPRMFHIAIAPGSIVDGGLTGGGDTETRAGLDVVSDYRAFEAEDVGTLLESDQWDLYDALEDSLDPTIAGLTHVEISGPPVESDEVSRYVFQFNVHYLRRR